MVLNVLIWVTVEVEVGMVGHVDDRLLVGSGAVGNVNGIVVSERIDHGGFHVAGEVVVTVGRMHDEGDGIVSHLGHFIHLILPSGGTAMILFRLTKIYA